MRASIFQKFIVTSCIIGSTFNAAPVLGLDGIAVSDVNGNGVYSHIIRNNSVVQTLKLIEGCCDGQNESGTKNANSPAINTFGTHVAFLRTSTKGNHVSVMRSDGKSAVLKDLITTAATIGALDWPQGDWIYYNIGAKLYKVNVQTSENKLVLTLSMPDKGISEYPFRDQFTMSADAKKMHLQLSEISNELDYLEGRYKILLSDNGILKEKVHGPGGGCGPAISPSGSIIGFQLDAGHLTRIWASWDDGGQSGNTNYLQWNRWSVDKDFSCTHKGSAGNWDENLGLGIIEKGNRFSRNSDHWIVLQIGWYPEGRFAKNNSNLAIINFRDSLSLNVSRYDRFASDAYKIPDNCTHVGTVVKRVNRGDFWLQSPIGSVYEPLRNDVINRESYKISCIDDNQQCPNSIILRATTHTPVHARSILYYQTNSMVHIANIPPDAATATLFTLNGELIWSKNVTNGKLSFTIKQGSKRLYILRAGKQSVPMLLN